MTWEQYQDKINKDFFGEKCSDNNRSKDMFYCNAGKVLLCKNKTDLVYRNYCCKLPDWVLQFR